MNFYDAQKFLTPFGLDVSMEQFYTNSKKMVVVGMSGGVDSSVSALILKYQGFNTIGMFMKNWDDTVDSQCTAKEDYNDVAKVCEHIGIQYYAINFVKEYRENVFKSFVEDYQAGITPNPDILCNKEIKFKVFFERAMALGADYLATGHYCQADNGRLIKGVDTGKDQSYFLYAVRSDVLANVQFPIGALEKKVVREIAKAYGLATSEKKDSTGICFIGERNFREFLATYIESTKGNYVRLDDGEVVGVHNGQCFYTIGQRKGLGLGGPGGPWFVAKKDAETNTVYVVEGENHPALYYTELWAQDIHWISGKAPELPLYCKAKIRYRQQDQDCLVRRDGDEL